ncbi:leucine-rich repeat domain-containing protein [Haliscomenobacter sp.]|uniref:leucine-rich repeat domain-containing protein n=1 Tax=Haliscomenobacter sp. TaxID=2717303 RepID=UPI003BA9349A
MAAVDTIYGVYIAEQGVSGVMPVDFRDYENVGGSLKWRWGRSVIEFNKDEMKKRVYWLILILIPAFSSFTAAQTSITDKEKELFRKMNYGYAGYFSYQNYIIDTVNWEKYRLTSNFDSIQVGIDGIHISWRGIYNKTPQDSILTKITALSASWDKGKDSVLFSWIRKMKNLKVLILLRNSYKKIPSEIYELNELVILSLEGNSISHISDSLTRLEKLSTLNLSDNDIQNGENLLSGLINLKQLILSRNKLSSFLLDFSKLKKLEHLDLSYNAIQSISENLGSAKQLNFLDLQFNQLAILPKTTYKLTELKVLDITGNKITEIADDLGDLSNLHKLEFSANKIKTVPSSIGKLVDLQKLSAWSNLIQEIPESIGNLSKLQYLNLSNNEIEKIPTSINQLKELIELDISGNAIATTGPALDGLSKLTEIDFSSNQNLIVASKMQTWTSLKELSIAYCNLKEIPFGVFGLKNLQHLNLAGNGATIASPELKKLPKLSLLDLSYNHIKNIPTFLFFMPSLKYIELMGNEITYLPKEYPYRKGPELRLKKNPILEHPSDLLKLSNWQDHLCDVPELYFLQKQFKKALEAATNCNKTRPYETTKLDPKNHIRYAMYAQDAQQTIDLATRFLTWHSTETYINARLIIGYIFNKQFSEAEKLILEWKGKKFSNGKDAHEYILYEIQLMEQNGIQHVDFARAKLLLK